VKLTKNKKNWTWKYYLIYKDVRSETLGLEDKTIIIRL